MFLFQDTDILFISPNLSLHNQKAMIPINNNVPEAILSYKKTISDEISEIDLKGHPSKSIRLVNNAEILRDNAILNLN